MNEINCYTTFDVYPIVWGAHIRPYYLTKELANIFKKNYNFINIKKLKLNFFKKDFISLFATTSILNLPIFFIKKIRNVLVTDVSDDPFWQSRDVGTKLPKEGGLLRVARFIQTRLSNCVCVGDMWLAKRIGIENFIEINNASDPKHFKYSKLPKNKKVIYVGGISSGRGIEMLIDACNYVVENLNYNNFKVGIYGRCVDKNYRKLLLAKMSNVKFQIKWVENVKYDDVPNILKEAYLCINVPKPNSYFDTGPNIKIFDYMASGRPVIVSNCKAQANLIKKEKCGVVCNFTVESIGKAIYSLFKNRKLAEKFGRRGREAVENRHSWYHRSLVLANYLKELVGGV
ncbi:MAG: glycosyltransferase [Candidatus Parvarchaeota archaeon]|nr:glycosyltransferase [Candidatus Jingweiarchaeum tengchongense]MCW1310749.1 glycosyltransferase [Candidatus Jingweiarchaeum tengchongense]